MAKWASAAFLDGSLDYLKANATHQVLVKAYAAADSYATVTGNACADQAMVSADFTKSSSGSNRVVTWAAKTAVPLTANSGARTGASRRGRLPPTRFHPPPIPTRTSSRPSEAKRS